MRLTLISAAAFSLSVSAFPAFAQALKLPDGPGKETTQTICGSCHGAELVIGRQETRDTWAAIVDDMIQRGANGSEEEFYKVVDYLANNFGPNSPAVKLNVNKASSQDLQAALRLPEKEASAIIKQRAEKGDFKTIDDLEKVPGVDAKKIEANKNRLSF